MVCHAPKRPPVSHMAVNVNLGGIEPLSIPAGYASHMAVNVNLGGIEPPRFQPDMLRIWL